MFPQSAMLCMVLVLCLMAGPAAGHVSQYSGTAVYTSETNLDGTGSYRGVSESVDNILGPVTCVTTGSFRPAAAGEGSCSAAESGASYFNIRSECEADSLDSPVTIMYPIQSPVFQILAMSLIRLIISFLPESVACTPPL